MRRHVVELPWAATHQAEVDYVMQCHALVCNTTAMPSWGHTLLPLGFLSPSGSVQESFKDEMTC